jgi:hypothetical protein
LTVQVDRFLPPSVVAYTSYSFTKERDIRLFYQAGKNVDGLAILKDNVRGLFASRYRYDIDNSHNSPFFKN